MAKGCLYYCIEICNGGEWKRHGRIFRDTYGAAVRRYNAVASNFDETYSVRLCEVKVLEQRNGITK